MVSNPDIKSYFNAKIKSLLLTKQSIQSPISPSTFPSFLSNEPNYHSEYISTPNTSTHVSETHNKSV